MKLTTSEVLYLGKYFETPTAISLMTNLQADMIGTEELSLVEKGILVSGELSALAKEHLEVLANPTTCTRIVLTNPFCVIEKYAYRMGDKKILVENDDGELEITVLEKESNIQMELAEWIGASNIKTADFQEIVGYADLLTLFALIDFHRANGLRSYLGEVAHKETIDLKRLVESIASPMPNSLVQSMRLNYGMPELETVVVEKALKNLSDKEIIKIDHGYALEGSFKLFAENFLIPETVVMMETLSVLADDSIKAANSLAYGAGLKDWIGVTFGSEDVEVETLTSIQLLQSVALYLGCPVE